MSFDITKAYENAIQQAEYSPEVTAEILAAEERMIASVVRDGYIEQYPNWNESKRAKSTFDFMDDKQDNKKWFDLGSELRCYCEYIKNIAHYYIFKGEEKIAEASDFPVQAFRKSGRILVYTKDKKGIRVMFRNGKKGKEVFGLSSRVLASGVIEVELADASAAYLDFHGKKHEYEIEAVEANQDIVKEYKTNLHREGEIEAQ